MNTINFEQSKILFENSKQLSPGGVHSPVRAFKGVGGTPPFIKKAKGAEITDVDGNRYIDYCMSWGPLILGHQDEEVATAVHEAIDRGWTYGTTEPYSLELAEFICQEVPWVENVRFVNSGTEAVLSALRVARAATGKNKILKFAGCYHGHVDSMLVKAGSGLAEMAEPDSAGLPTSVANETIVVPLDDINAVKQAFAHHDDIAAVIVEPVPANNGLLIQKPDFLKELRNITSAHQSLLIFDEVITGFRVALGGMAEISGIKPDLVTYGKVIGGGFPVGAYGGKKELMQQVAPAGAVYQAGTLSANPVAMSAGLATLKKLKRDRPYAKLQKKTEALANLLKKEGISVQTFGSLFWMVGGKASTDDGFVRSVDQIPSTQNEIFKSLFHTLLGKGFYLAPSGFEVGFMSTVHTDEQNQNLAQSIVETHKKLGLPDV